MPSALHQLPPELVALLARGVSVLVASRDERLRPSVMRAMGCSVDAQSGCVTVFLARSQAADLLRDIERSGQLAAMFSQPSTHLSLQLKASAYTQRAATEADREVLDRYVAAMSREIEAVGHPASMARVMLACRIEDLVALTFEPDQAFEQTPGPRAGTQAGAGAA